MKKLFSILQKIGKSLMLPVSVLPAAGILLRLGQPDLLNMPYVATAGDAIFANLPMIFAVGVAIGFSGGEATAALAAVVGQFILQGILEVAGDNFAQVAAEQIAKAQGIALDVFKNSAEYAEIVRLNKINMGVFGGIIIGLTAAILYNKYHNIKLPQALGFFAGKRFVPIVTSIASLIIAVIGVKVWPELQKGIDAFAQWASISPYGPALYASGKRLLIPVGLHHVYYPPFLYQFGEYISDGVSYLGDFARFYHGDPNAGIFMASEYPNIMFGLPGAALAMVLTAKKENRKAVAGMMGSAALVAFVTGITEPIEFSFIFVAPILFVFHVLAAFLGGLATKILGIRLGYTFSASAIDYILGFKFAGNPILIWPLGITFFILYFVVFYFVIKKFNIATPGRENNEETKQVATNNLDKNDRSVKILEALGGEGNIKELDACMTRLRLNLVDPSKVNKNILKALGSAGVMEAGNSVQVIFGTEAEGIKDDIKNIINNSYEIFEEKANYNKKEDLQVEFKENKIKEEIILTPIEGEVVELDKVPDEVFSQKMLGDGFAVKIKGDKIYAPIEGEISVLFPTKHAIAITTNSGLEILIHVGIDTVELQGEGFISHVKQGDIVKKGDLLLSVDKDFIKNKGKSLITPVIVTNMEKVESLKIFTGENTNKKAAIVKLK